MLNFSQEFCNKLNFNSFSIWSNHNNFSNYLDSNLINISIKDTYFILKILNQSIPKLENFDNWNISMSDSDVF